MEYEKVNEAEVYRTACENVKTITKAIKAIKIKYYPNFSKISEKDQGVYDELNQKLEQISEKHGLNRLKVALMGEISTKYDNEKENGENGQQKSLDEILLQCYGAIDAEQQALSLGKIGQALKCQKALEQYKQKIELMPEKERLLARILEYKREKLGELTIEKEAQENNSKKWENRFKGFFEQTNAENRKEVKDIEKDEQVKNEIQLER